MLEAVLKSFVSAGVMALLLFWPAGTLAWPQGWLFLLLFNACSVATGIWLWTTDPDLLRERTKSPWSGGAEAARPADHGCHPRRIGALAGVQRLRRAPFRLVSCPGRVQALGAVLIIGAFLGWATVLRVNHFAATQIRLQRDRGQVVISAGPYAVVRHPMYGYALLLLVGTPLLLGSLWGLLGVTVAVPLLGARALAEEALLADGLPGYRDYAEKVRYRFVPGIW